MTLKDALKDWTDFDVAEHRLAACLGLTDNGLESFRENKGIYWSNNSTGETLAHMLSDLVKLGVLLFDEEETRFKWNEEYSFK